MNAHETHLGKILEGIKQYMVPLFQRPYTWDESRWKVFWADLMELCEDEQGTELAKPHFLGSIVTVPTRLVPEADSTFPSMKTPSSNFKHPRHRRVAEQVRARSRDLDVDFDRLNL